MRSASIVASSSACVIRNTVAPVSPPQAQELVAHQQPRLLIERAERLVEQDQSRLHHQRARDAHALAHAARELRGIARSRNRTSPTSFSASRTRSSFSARGKRGAAQPERDVVGDVEPRQRSVVLEHDADAFRRLAARSGVLRTRSCLRSAGVRPAISSSSVDLPQPEGPTTAKNSPRLMLEIDRARARAAAPAGAPP